ncbi:MAG: AsnC family transcriptional regulator [Fimbriimonadaceae bacterium]|nr:AsnC family transcriptional regulator [Alphaproteobacteria bacterium]
MTEYAPDAIDREIIKATQTGLPKVPQPYHAIGEMLGLDGADVVARMRAMKHHGVIRRMGVIPNHYALGITANGMSVWDVPDAKISDLGALVGGLDYVSHCYHRPRHLPFWSFNLFAMVHGKSRDEVHDKVARIAALLGADARDHDVLFSKRILKKTGLRLAA